MRRRRRIVSLLPSATELVAAVGAVEELVGVSHECDFPEAVRQLPVLTRSRVPPEASSREIDAAVRSVLGNHKSLYELEVERFLDLEPDVVLTQDLCEVCAVSLDEVHEVLAAARRLPAVRIVNLRPLRFQDLFSDLARVAEALDRVEEGMRVEASLRQRIGTLRERIELRSLPAPRVLTLEWVDPWMIGGTWMPDLVRLAGGEPVGMEPGMPGRRVEVDELVELECEVVWIKPCGLSLARALREVQAEREPLGAWWARGVRVIVSDGHHLFNRPGPRLVDSLELLASWLWPEAFPDLGRALEGWAVQLLGSGQRREPWGSAA